jgi:hypothetical protein
METTYSPPQAELTFPPQAPFSWTLRWAKAHRSERTKAAVRKYRIAGSAANDEELAAAVAFCELHGATLERV